MSPRKKENKTLIFALLGFFLEQPYHGYELYKHIQLLPEFKKIWSIKQSLFYGYLDKFHNEGYLFQEILEGGIYPDRKVYHITNTGREKVLDWMIDPVLHGREMRQEFLAKLFFAMRQESDIAKKLLNNQKTECETWLNVINSSQAGDNIYEDLIIQYRFRQIKAMIDWLIYVEQKTSAGRKPEPGKRTV